ncbi:MAG TPA: bile acid:sodium symporter, partial [Steroidobacteraceae bacterium]|nr:bile acid:sodium symporter [Steroidobacteraceae bacterium]
QASLAVIVFCVALNAQRGDMVSLLRRPGLWLRSILAMNIIMPLIAVLLAGAFALNRQIEVALIALAVSPVPPILPNKLMKAGASRSYSVALLALSAAMAVVLIPATIWLLGQAFGREVLVPPAAVFKAVAMSVLAPLLAGALVRELAPNVAAKISGPMAKLANVLLLAAFVPVVVVAWPELVKELGNFTLVAIAVLTLGGLLVGHVLGGPHDGDRTALALSTASKHPGVAIAVAGIIAPGDKSIVAAVLLAFLFGILVTAPYTRRRQKKFEELKD